MVVYIEQVLVDNIIINYLLLTLINAVFKNGASKKRMWLSSIVCSVLSLAYPFLTFDWILVNAYKLFVAFVMIMIAFKVLKKKFVLYFFTLLSFTYVLGGLVNACIENVLIQSGIMFYQSKVPFGVTIFICYVYVLILKKLIISLRQKIKQNNYVYTCTLINNEKKITTNCFLDSGNNLLDGATKKPINIINADLLFKITEIKIEDLLTQNYSSLKNAHHLSVQTVSGTSKILVFAIDKLELKDDKKVINIEEPLLGLTYTKLKTKTNCSMVLNAQIL